MGNGEAGRKSKYVCWHGPWHVRWTVTQPFSLLCSHVCTTNVWIIFHDALHGECVSGGEGKMVVCRLPQSRRYARHNCCSFSWKHTTAQHSLVPHHITCGRVLFAYGVDFSSRFFSFRVQSTSRSDASNNREWRTSIIKHRRHHLHSIDNQFCIFFSIFSSDSLACSLPTNSFDSIKTLNNGKPNNNSSKSRNWIESLLYWNVSTYFAQWNEFLHCLFVHSFIRSLPWSCTHIVQIVAEQQQRFSIIEWEWVRSVLGRMVGRHTILWIV